MQLAGATPEIADIAEFYDDAWEAQAADAQLANCDDVDAIKRSGARLLRLYLEEVAPKKGFQPAKLEQKVTGEIGGVQVQGYIDQVDADGRILDVKTAEKSPASVGSDYAFQLATYRQILPGANGKARIDYLVNNKTPKLVTIEYEVTVADQLLTCNLYPRVREGIREGLYFPNRNSNLCSRKYCNFCDACQKEFGGDLLTKQPINTRRLQRRAPGPSVPAIASDPRLSGASALKRAAIYVRVSTAHHTRNGNGFEQNPEVQEVPLRQLLEQRGWTLTRRLLRSAQRSERESFRPGRLMDDATRAFRRSPCVAVRQVCPIHRAIGDRVG